MKRCVSHVEGGTRMMTRLHKLDGSGVIWTVVDGTITHVQGSPGNPEPLQNLYVKSVNDYHSHLHYNWPLSAISPPFSMLHILRLYHLLTLFILFSYLKVFLLLDTSYLIHPHTFKPPCASSKLFKPQCPKLSWNGNSAYHTWSNYG